MVVWLPNDFTIPHMCVELHGHPIVKISEGLWDVYFFLPGGFITILKNGIIHDYLWLMHGYYMVNDG